MKRYFFLALGLIAAIAFVRASFYTVDAAEYAYVTVFGEHTATFDGKAENGAGLKFGWPWPVQQVKRIDRRLQQFDLPEFEQLTHEGETVDKILVLQAYVCWKIADEPDAVQKFVVNVGSVEEAKPILSRSINSKLGAFIGQKRMDDLVSTAADPKTGVKHVDVTARDLHDDLLRDVSAEARGYGIELVDVRLRRFNHPSNVRDSIYQRIRSERNKEAAKYISDGDFQASKKVSEADQEVRLKLVEAKARETKILAAADIEANKIRNDAYSKDPEFYAFVKKMEDLQSIVGGKNTILLLSTHRPMFESMFTPPRSKTSTKDTKDTK